MRLFLILVGFVFTATCWAGPHRHHKPRLCIDPGNYYYESTQFERYPGYNYSVGSYYYYPGYYYYEPKYYFPKKAMNRYLSKRQLQEEKEILQEMGEDSEAAKVE